MIFNILTTHTNAGSKPEAAKARLVQLKEINKFIDSLKIPKDKSEAILIMGDMNIDYARHPFEAIKMINELNVSLPQFIGEQLYTLDPQTNYLTGKD